MFGALKDRHGAAGLSEVKRQHKVDERRAAEMMAEGNFHDALGIYQQKGSIHWTRTQGEARAELVEQWAKDSAAKPDKTRFVFAYTNDDVTQLNAALRAVGKERGELVEDQALDTAHGRQNFAAGDRIQFTGRDKKAGIVNGSAGTIEAIDGSHIAVRLDGRQPKTINFDAASFDQFRHGYAGTIYRGQGRTLDQTYLYHSEHWRSAASYVALTRHRDKAELFVARNTARDVNQLARQMGRTDERRAASMFHHRQEIGPVRPLSARKILARFGGEQFTRTGPAAGRTEAAPERDGREAAPEQRPADGPQDRSTAKPANENRPEQRPADAPSPASVTESRAPGEIGREEAELSVQQRAEAAVGRAAATEAGGAERAIREAAAGIEHETGAIRDAAESTVDTTARASSRILASLTSVIEGAVETLASFFSAPPKLTPEQAKRAEQAGRGKGAAACGRGGRSAARGGCGLAAVRAQQAAAI
jgi:hypothetical protein